MPMALSMTSSRLSGAGGLGYSGSLGWGGGGGGGGGMAMALRSGASYGMGLGMGGGGGGGHGAGMGFGMGMGIGLGAGGGGGGGGALMSSPAFSMGRTMAIGGISAGASLAAAASAPLGPMLAPVLSRAAVKQTLSVLNERFSGYMVKVKQLQQENVTLEARLAQLTGGSDVSPGTAGTTTTTAEYETQLMEYRVKLESLTLDTVKLEVELDGIRGTAHELKAKYDFEQGVKCQLEADIASMKRDIDMASDLRIELDATQSSLKDEMHFVTKTQDEELFSLQSKLGTMSTDTSVSMIEVDMGKSFDIASALNKLRIDYEKSVNQHREEADAYYKIKMEEVQAANASSSEAISSAKAEIMSCKKELQVLSLELQSLVNMNLTLEHSMAEAHAASTGGVAGYQAQIASLENAIEVTKADMLKQILCYQELLDIKLALDAEIATYRTLLDGDDISFSIQSYGSTPFFLSSSPGPSSTKADLSLEMQDKETVPGSMSFKETSYTYKVTEEVIESESQDGVITGEAHSETTTMASDVESEP